MAFSSLLHRASSYSYSYSTIFHRNFGAQFLQFLRFSTTVTNNNLVSVIQSQIESSESPYYQRWSIPNGAENDHPFQMTDKYKDEDGKIFLIFTRQSCLQYHKHEETTLQVCEDAYHQVITADDGTPKVLPIFGSFSTAGYNPCLNFEATAEPEMIHVHTLKMSDLTDNLQFLEDYLGAKGINATMIDILFDGFRRNDDNLNS